MNARVVEKILMYSIQAVIGIGLLYSIISDINSPPASKQFAERFKKEKFNLIIQDKGIEGRETYLKGIDPQTHKQAVYRESIGALSGNLHLINKGDTLFKKAGTYSFIKKTRNGVQIIPWRAYQDTVNK